jgi:Winged helix DNA-binding domain
MDIAERRARLGRRHHLAPSSPAASPLEVARSLVAFHATDPATVFLSAAARLKHPEVKAIEDALYVDRVLVRMLGMRRTMFVVPADVASVVQAACTQAIAQRLRRTYQRVLQQAGLAGDVPSWLARVEDATVAALKARGEATAQELAQDVPELKTQVLLAAGKSYAAMQAITTHVLMQLSADGRVMRGRPRGSWVSSQYRWATVDAWLPGGVPKMSTAAAQVLLVRGWLQSFGPGTPLDLKWWTGLTMGEVKRALAQLDVAQVDLGDSAGLVLADDLEPTPPPERWVSLLPGLDATPMGYAERSWFLGSHGPSVFDRSGNVGPTVWCDGRIVGGWAQRRNGEIALRLLEDMGRDAEQRVDAAAHALSTWLGPIRITPRFRTPLERELAE